MTQVLTEGMRVSTGSSFPVKYSDSAKNSDSAAALQFPQKLHDAIIDYMRSRELGVSIDEVDSLHSVIWRLGDTLGLVYGREERFAKLPEMFKNYFDVKRYHEKPTVGLSMERVERAGSALEHSLAPCTFLRTRRFEAFLTALNETVGIFQAKAVSMRADAARDREAERSRTDLSKIDATVIEKSESGTAAIYAELEAKLSRLDDYHVVTLERTDIDRYSPPKTKDEANGRVRRQRWRENLRFHGFAVKTFRYDVGGGRPSLLFLWKLPVHAERSDSKDAAAILQLKKLVPEFHSRRIKREALESLSKVAAVDKAILRHLYSILTSDGSAPHDDRQRKMDERCAEFFASGGDLELWPDLRALNGNDGDKFNEFWAEAAKLVDELGGATEGRHGTHLSLSQPTSVPDFLRRVEQRMKDRHCDAPIPSPGWVAFQFLPTHPHAAVATRYTGRFNMKRKVSSRTLRCRHQDVHFCCALAKYVKCFTLEFNTVLDDCAAAAVRDDDEDVEVFADSIWPRLAPVQPVSSDDKAKAPAGEPGKPVDVGVRPASKSLCHENVELLALDHGWHRASITPSVNLIQNIPGCVGESWRPGTLCVTLKDSVLEASSPWRHHAELLQQLRTLSRGSGVCRHRSNPSRAFVARSLSKHLASPARTALPFVLIVKSDGGPDHNMKNGSVQVALLALFLAGGFDAVIAHRLAPDWSFQNEAEGCMAVLNLGLQHAAFERQQMDAEYETLLRSDSSMAQIRTRIGTLEDGEAKKARDAWRGSLAPVLAELKVRFEGLQFSGEPVIVAPSATEADILGMHQYVKQIDPTWNAEMTTKPQAGDRFDNLLFSRIFHLTRASPVLSFVFHQLEQCSLLNEFFKTHTSRHKYIMEIVKCGDKDCKFASVAGCGEPRMPRDAFEIIAARPKLIPFPMNTDDSGKEHFATYDQLKLQSTTDSHMPSFEPPKKPDPEKKKIDTAKPVKFTKETVRHRIICDECNKPRSIVAAKKPSALSLGLLTAYCENNLYICGAPLFDSTDNPLAEQFFIREAIVCFTPVEKIYYGSNKFAPCCAICGDEKQSIFANPESDEMKTMCGGKKSYPICTTCVKEGYKPVTHGAEVKTASAYRSSKGAKRRKAAKSKESDGEDESSNSDEAEDDEPGDAPAARTTTGAESESAGENSQEENVHDDDEDDEAVDNGNVGNGGSSRRVKARTNEPVDIALFDSPSPSGCVFGPLCKFPALPGPTLNTCLVCSAAVHRECCVQSPIVNSFVAEEEGSHAYCFDCAAMLGVSRACEAESLQQLPSLVALRKYYAQIDWSKPQAQTSRTLSALMTAGILDLHEGDQNGRCETCDGDKSNDEDPSLPALLLCSFCNVAFHNSVSCLGAKGGSVAPESVVANSEWSCPSCWREATRTAAKQRSGQHNHTIGAKRKAPKGGRGGRGGGRARGGAARGRGRGRGGGSRS